MSEAAAPFNFMGLEPEMCERGKSRFIVIPAPMEATVSYMGGTARGPEAIIDASRQVELFDGKSIPAEAGIHTIDALDIAGLSGEEALAPVEKAVAEALAEDKIPVTLGGEHAVTIAPLRALKKSKTPGFGVVQFDAHLDLREEYEGDPLSHACVMMRAVEMGIPVFQIGCRSGDEGEYEARRKHNVGFLDAADVARGGVPAKILPDDFPETIYITFDVDGLDPSVVPATGTPEPGGLGWYDALDALAGVISGRRVAGFDMVELAPAPGLHMADFAVAKLVYRIMGMVIAGESNE